MEATDTIRSTTSVSIKLSKEKTKEGAMLWCINYYGKNVATAPIWTVLAPLAASRMRSPGSRRRRDPRAEFYASLQGKVGSRLRS